MPLVYHEGQHFGTWREDPIVVRIHQNGDALAMKFDSFRLVAPVSLLLSQSPRLSDWVPPVMLFTSSYELLNEDVQENIELSGGFGVPLDERALAIDWGSWREPWKLESNLASAYLSNPSCRNDKWNTLLLLGIEHVDVSHAVIRLMNVAIKDEQGLSKFYGLLSEEAEGGHDLMWLTPLPKRKLIG